MKIRKPYKGMPIGFSDGVTNSGNGIIYDVYLTGSNGDSFIGRIGKWTDGHFSGPAFSATPTGYSPFTNRARTFYTRKDAAIWLLGVEDSQRNWMAEHKANPVSGTTHIPLSAE